MTPEQIRCYRAHTWDEFIGAENAPSFRRLQAAAMRGEPPPPLLLVAPYGSVKTTLARHLMRAFGCPFRDPRTGDPCQECEECQRIGPDFAGEGKLYARWEIDCTRISSKAEVLDYLALMGEEGERLAVFWDEFHRLADRQGADALLKFTEDFTKRCKGLWIIAITDDEFERIRGPLFERFRKVWLVTPTAEEMVAYFCRLAPRLEVNAPPALIRELVIRSARSFRTCFDVLAAAKEDPCGTLTAAILDEFLPRVTGKPAGLGSDVLPGAVYELDES